MSLEEDWENEKRRQMREQLDQIRIQRKREKEDLLQGLLSDNFIICEPKDSKGRSKEVDVGDISDDMGVF